ncbi:MAG: enoyl-CoA hydratase/isomerase family protein [Chloroflexi bacterium]|nr:enoyl-CoA hydratase/isomerase family protein [Chloroflexota bacterium]
MGWKNIKYEVKDNIGWITLNRPQKLNAINDAMSRELDEVLNQAEMDLEAKVLVFKGAGRAFSSGQDMSGVGTSEFLHPDPWSRVTSKELLEGERRRQRRWEYIFNMAKPTIAQVHGYCLGAGLNLAMVCDITIASEDATFGDLVTRMGILPTMPLWPWVVGMKKTREMLFTGRYFGAKEAESIGMVNKVVPVSKLDEEVLRWAQGIARLHSDGLAYAKDAINGVMECRGVGAAFRFTTDIQMAGLQRPAKAEDLAFYELRDKKGLRAALEARDAPFKNFP